MLIIGYFYFSTWQKSGGQNARELLGLTRDAISTTTIESRPAKEYVCRRSIVKPEKGVIGISLAYAYEPEVLTYLDELGIKWVRADFHWDLIDRGGTYNWKVYDQFVTEMAKRNIKILATINRIPAGMSDWPEVYERLTRFEASLVDRYRPGGVLATRNGWTNYGVSYWEIFNEPNLPGHGWLGSSANAADTIPNYAQILRNSNQIIHQIDPAAVIVLAGMSPSGYSPVKYWQDLYGRGLKDCFDVLAFHPYGYGGKFAQVASSLKILTTAYGDKNKTIWFNEYGTDHPKEQVDLIKKFFAEKNTVPAVFWYTLRDSSKTYDYGLRDNGYKTKPTYDLFRQLLSKK